MRHMQRLSQADQNGVFGYFFDPSSTRVAAEMFQLSPIHPSISKGLPEHHIGKLHGPYPDDQNKRSRRCEVRALR